MIHDKDSIPPTGQRLLFGGKLLDDRNFLNYYNLQN